MMLQSPWFVDELIKKTNKVIDSYLILLHLHHFSLQRRGSSVSEPSGYILRRRSRKRIIETKETCFLCNS